MNTDKHGLENEAHVAQTELPELSAVEILFCAYLCPSVVKEIFVHFGGNSV